MTTAEPDGSAALVAIQQLHNAHVGAEARQILFIWSGIVSDDDVFESG
ncbi:MAG TPA: hypothetical protein VFE51_17505 [Verrucomicrobiae bacterium]|nr:hypothetical protein [Verrucomicrobiae bacterium]